MATTTKAEAIKETNVLDPWQEKVTIKIPRESNGEANYLIASVNGKVFKIQRGVNVEVPKPIAEVIEHSFEAEDEAIAYIDKLSN